MQHILPLPCISAYLLDFDLWIMKIIFHCHQLKTLMMFFKGSGKMSRAAMEEEMDTLLYILWNIVFKVILLLITDTRSKLPNTRETPVISHRGVTPKKLFLFVFSLTSKNTVCRTESIFENPSWIAFVLFVCCWGLFWVLFRKKIIFWVCFFCVRLFFSELLRQNCC